MIYCTASASPSNSVAHSLFVHLCGQHLAGECRLEAMRAAQFSSRGATPHEEQALLRQAKVLAAQQQASQPAPATQGKGSRGRGRGAASSRSAAGNGPESPQPAHTSLTPAPPPQGTFRGCDSDSISAQWLYHAVRFHLVHFLSRHILLNGFQEIVSTILMGMVHET